MKRTLVIATVDWATITGPCLVLAEGGFGVPRLIEISDEGLLLLTTPASTGGGARRPRVVHYGWRGSDHASDNGRGDRRCRPLWTVHRSALVATRRAVSHIRQADGELAHPDAPRHASEV